MPQPSLLGRVVIFALLAWAGVTVWVSNLAAAPPEAKNAAPATASPGQQLYARHCGACHGDQGDGQGVASLFLLPKARNFRSGRFRLVSTPNNVPSRDDLHAVLERGMPGSSMPSWAHLPKAERDLLVDEVLRLLHDGARDRRIASLREQGYEDSDFQDNEVLAEIKQFVEQQTTAEAASEVPATPAEDAAAAARGKELYAKQGCLSCHGAEGKGDGVQKMIDADGLENRPRDLTRGIFKGGHDFASLYRRVNSGMPGSAMPSSANLTPAQVGDMVAFVRSLSTEEQRQQVVLKRGRLEVPRVAAAPAAPDDKAWASAASLGVQTIPLWWRDNAVPQLSAKAVHDGKNLAVLLEWRDATANVRAVRADEFEDMAAIEFYQGAAEPFLGMGSAADPIDLWHWRAGLHDAGAELSQLDEYPFDTPLYHELAKGEKLPDFITARAGGNPLATRQQTAHSLAAKGPGSTTFRPQPSQVTAARGAWEAGTWRVVFVRPLAVGGEAGLPLVPGKKYSVAFALWEGAARDRGPQKQISIWHDFVLQ